MRRTRRADPWTQVLPVAAAAFAAAEIGAGLWLANFFDWGRAEALLFLAFRPWLLLAAAWLAAGLDLRRRALVYLLSLATAGVAESLLLVALGGAPWMEMLRGWAAGLVLVAAMDLALQLGARAFGRAGRAIAAVLVALAMFVPGAMRPYDALVLGPDAPRGVASRPPLMLMTGLPLVWGEAGPFDPASRPAAAYRALQWEFDVRPIDHLNAASLGAARLLLLAQPRALEPVELVAVDAWVRAGGRVLILADPDLAWPSRLPPGDVRRPPPASLLAPLLDHWGLRLAGPRRPGPVVDHLERGGVLRRLVLVSPGQFTAAGSGCRVGPRDYLAACTVGRGGARLVADADLMHDDTWVGPTADGLSRAARRADNVLLVADWLDNLAGTKRARAARPIRWQRPGASRATALALAATPVLLLLGAAGLAAAATRRP